MPLNEKTWQFDTNRVMSFASVLDGARYVQWYIKAFARGQIGGATLGLWSCEGSSDAATAGMDATDRYGAAYDGSKIVRAAAGVAHSWMVIGKGSAHLCIDYSTASDENADMYWSANAFTGGSTTNRPTSVGEMRVGGNVIELVEAATNPHKIHGRLATDGSLFVVTSKDGSGHFWFGLAAGQVTDTKAGEAYPAFLYAEYSSNPGAFDYSTVGGFGSRWCCRNHDNTSTPSSRSGVFPASTSGSVLASSGPVGPDEVDSRFNDWPMHLATNAPSSIRGRVVDWMWIAQNTNDGDTDPLAGPPERMVVGSTMIPTNTAPAL